jgi:hypothetical protein
MRSVVFSDRRVARILNTRYACAWESVRPVPRVEIDFGNGHRLTRTLNGNVATYLCDSDGHVRDIIPGLASPGEVLRRLGGSASEAHELDAETEQNRRLRMPKVRTLLAECPDALPQEITRRVFAEILDVDLDDPYLGLAPHVVGGEPGRR